MYDDREKNLNESLKFIWPALQLSQQRMDAANRRLEVLMALSLGSLSVGAVPTTVALEGIQSIFSLWFLGAVTTLALSWCVSLIYRTKGAIETTSLLVVAENAAEYHEEFSKWLIKEAGKQVDSNGEVTRRKWFAATVSTILVAIEVLLLAAWVVSTAASAGINAC